MSDDSVLTLPASCYSANTNHEVMMATSLYDLSVAAYTQTLNATSRYLEKGLAHCREHNVDPSEIVDIRLFSDMLPFRFQIQSVCHHAVGTIEGFRSGAFTPSGHDPSHDYETLQAQVKDALATLAKETPDGINALAGNEIVFKIGDTALKFDVPDFVLTFSLPNFHFHATTAYDILRSRGVPLGKRDYLGRLKFKR